MSTLGIRSPKPEASVSVGSLNRMTLALASNNAHKVLEIAGVLGLQEGCYHTMRELGITDEPCEDATSFEGNALIKARFVQQRSNRATIADDSGLEVDALGGAPGVFSARYAGEKASDADNVRKLLAALEAVPSDQRSARFVCVVAFIDECGIETVVQGVCEGMLTRAPQGEGGFGYDPLFIPRAIPDGRTMAELSFEEKNALSHRGRALRALREVLDGRYA